MRTEFSKCMIHALWTKQSQLESQKYGSSYVLGPRKSKEHEKEATTKIIILAFYFIDPVPMFLVRDYFSCKSHPQINVHVAFKLITCCVKAIHAAAPWHPGE